MLDLDIIELETDDLIDEAYSRGFIDKSVIPPSEDTGNFFLFRCGKKSVLLASKGIYLEVVKELSYNKIAPKDIEQICAFHSMKNFELTVLLGNAGSGKTTLACAYAVNQIFKANKRVIFTKSTALVGGRSTAVGTIPGNLDEKLEPYLSSYYSALRTVLGEHNFEIRLLDLKENGQIQFVPIETLRGCDFKDAIVICDEVQNLSVHELNTIMSRVSTGSRCILMGDLSQIDVKLKKEDTGIYKLVNSESFLGSDIAIGVQLTHCYRSGVAKLAIDWMEEITSF